MPPCRPVPARLSRVCEGCGYSLTGLVSRRCPECGKPFTLAVRRAAEPVGWKAVWLEPLMLGIGLFAWFLVILNVWSFGQFDSPWYAMYHREPYYRFMLAMPVMAAIPIACLFKVHFDLSWSRVWFWSGICLFLLSGMLNFLFCDRPFGY